MIFKKEKIAVALSGGVDSAVSAYLLKKQGFDIFAITMKLPVIVQNGLKTKIPDDVENVCKALDIPLYVIDLKNKFKKYVIDYFCSEYLKGRTPNPCVICNKFIKFGVLLKEAQKLGADFLATGHYAKIFFDEESRKFYIQKAVNLKKDQSYFLSFLNQNQLSEIKFPLGDFASKDEIRQIAKSMKLPVHEKTDSQEICFVPNDDYRKCLRMLGVDSDVKKGDIVLSDGKKIGEHKGIINYTIGQRKGLGHNEKVYVKALDVENNLVIADSDEELYSRECIAEIFNLIQSEKFQNPRKVKARIRYRHKEQLAKAQIIENNQIKIIFGRPQRAITKGQILTIYEGDLVVGGGIIV